MAETITLGIVGIKNMGEYDSQTNYEKLNVVTYQGSTYCALRNTKGNLPTDTDYWQLYAEKGGVGPEGPQGPQGPTPVKGTDYYTAEDKAELESTLSDDVTSEVTEQLEDLVSATPLAASSVAGMTDTTRIYVNTTDGHWYWYNGTTWTDGGVYQSTGIDNKAITQAMLSDEVIDDFNFSTIISDLSDAPKRIGTANYDATTRPQASIIFPQMWLPKGTIIEFIGNATKNTWAVNELGCANKGNIETLYVNNRLKDSGYLNATDLSVTTYETEFNGYVGLIATNRNNSNITEDDLLELPNKFLIKIPHTVEVNNLNFDNSLLYGNEIKFTTDFTDKIVGTRYNHSNYYAYSLRVEKKLSKGTKIKFTHPESGDYKFAVVEVSDIYRTGSTTYNDSGWINDSGEYVLLNDCYLFITFSLKDITQTMTEAESNFLYTQFEIIPQNQINTLENDLNNINLDGIIYKYKSEKLTNVYGKSNNNLKRLSPITTIDFGSGSLQSACIVLEKNEIYKLWDQASNKLMVYNLNGQYKRTDTLSGSYGHGNDSCYYDGKIYTVNTDNKKVISVIDLEALTVQNIDFTGVILDKENADTRTIGGVCETYHNSGELYIVCEDLGSNALSGNTNNRLSIYKYNIENDTCELIQEFTKDFVFVQGAVCINNYLYVNCNIMTTGSAGNYKGIEIKVIDMNTNTIIDTYQFEGFFEGEGLDYIYENDIAKIYMGIAHYGEFSYLVKFVTPY